MNRRRGWRCMVCKDNRPVGALSVQYRPVAGAETRFPGIRTNVRFCNDRHRCTALGTAPGPWPPPAALPRSPLTGRWRLVDYSEVAVGAAFGIALSYTVDGLWRPFVVVASTAVAFADRKVRKVNQ